MPISWCWRPHSQRAIGECGTGYCLFEETFSYSSSYADRPSSRYICGVLFCCKLLLHFKNFYPPPPRSTLYVDTSCARSARALSRHFRFRPLYPALVLPQIHLFFFAAIISFGDYMAWQSIMADQQFNFNCDSVAIHLHSFHPVCFLIFFQTTFRIKHFCSCWATTPSSIRQWKARPMRLRTFYDSSIIIYSRNVWGGGPVNNRP